MSRCHWRSLPLLVLLALALGACGSGESPPPLPEPAVQPPPTAGGDIEDEIFPHVSARMPGEGLDPDGRVARWALGAQVGGSLHALAEACGLQDAAGLARMQDAQRAEVVAQGVDAERFDAVWTWAYRQARHKITRQSRPELERGCHGLRSMDDEAQWMEQMMQSMPLP